MATTAPTQMNFCEGSSCNLVSKGTALPLSYFLLTCSVTNMSCFVVKKILSFLLSTCQLFIKEWPSLSTITLQI